MSNRARPRARGFLRNTGGAAALEFAMVGIPFLWLLMGALELGVMSLAQSSLDNATATVSRRIRIGDPTMIGTTNPDAMEDAVYAASQGIISLTRAKIFADVRSESSFAGIAQDQIPVLPNTQYDPGGADEIVLVRVYYQWSVLTPFMSTFINSPGGQRVLVSSLLFRNEPF